jgi:hypothetical protein
MERYEAARQAEVLAALAEKEALHQVPSTVVDKCGGNYLEQLNMLVDNVFVRVIAVMTVYPQGFDVPSSSLSPHIHVCYFQAQYSFFILSF